jgi:hypothetical protein
MPIHSLILTQILDYYTSESNTLAYFVGGEEQKKFYTADLCSMSFANFEAKMVISQF